MKGKNEGLTKEKITAVILFGLSFFYMFYALRLKSGTIKIPGPGFIPILIGVLLLLCTALYLIRVFSVKSPEKQKGHDAPTESTNYVAVLGILACTIAYPFLLPAFKFILSTLAVTFVMLIVLKPRRPVYTLFLAAAASVSAFLVFGRLLGVALPAGYIEEILGRIGG